MEILHYVEDIGQLNCRVRLFAHELLFANTEESVAMSMFHLNDTMTLMLETYNGILLGDSLRSGSGSGANVSESTRGSGLLTEKPIQVRPGCSANAFMIFCFLGLCHAAAPRDSGKEIMGPRLILPPPNPMTCRFSSSLHRTCSSATAA